MRLYVLLLLALLLSACATPPAPEARLASAEERAHRHDWQRTSVPAGSFTLTTFQSNKVVPQPTLTIYLEGDGFAWVTSSQPSLDPTPTNPIALLLALAQPSGNAAYLARPCQYTATNGCDQRYWTNARFAPEVLDSMNRAVDVLKARHGAARLTLVGYSGGGTMAALIAANRNDVERLITVAGNLDHRAWTRYQRIDPLTGSLNAADVADKLVGLPQTHFIGARDSIIPPELAREFPIALRGTENRNLRIMPNYDHHCCWANNWRALWSSR